MSKTDWWRAAKIARMLSSDRDGEVIAAARKLLHVCGDVHVLAERIEGGGASRKAAAFEAAAEEFGARPCQDCGAMFVGKATAKFCSSACRVRAHRRGL
jgi:hypothetical protein